MLSYKISVIFFVLIIIIFIICTIFLSKLSSNENFNSISTEERIDENLKSNLQLVEKFKKNQLKFNTIDNPSKVIIKNQTFYDTTIFPNLSNINYNIVKNEFSDYLNKSNNNWIDWPEYNLWKNENSNSSWKVIPLMSFGKWSEKYTKLFPKTAEQLRTIKGLVTAGFSKLGPKTKLTLHKGWGNLSNNVLRCHLGLSVPDNKCKVYVLGISNDVMIQKEGKWIIFDDSLYHSASNDDDIKDRIILLLDIERPEHIEKGVSDIENSYELNNFVAEFNKNL